jgi:hypothetical protein
MLTQNLSIAGPALASWQLALAPRRLEALRQRLAHLVEVVRHREKYEMTR